MHIATLLKLSTNLLMRFINPGGCTGKFSSVVWVARGYKVTRHVTHGYAYLYYYRRAVTVRKKLSSKFDEFLAARSQFDSDHGVDFYAHTYMLPIRDLWNAFCVSPLFFTTKNHKQRHRCDESVSIGMIDQLRRANDDLNALLQINR